MTRNRIVTRVRVTRHRQIPVIQGIGLEDVGHPRGDLELAS
jgi:hypothetical protein